MLIESAPLDKPVVPLEIVKPDIRAELAARLVISLAEKRQRDPIERARDDAENDEANDLADRLFPDSMLTEERRLANERIKKLAVLKVRKPGITAAAEAAGDSPQADQAA